MSGRHAGKRRGMSGRSLAGVAIAGAMIGLWVSPGRAYADPVDNTDPAVYVSRVAPAPAGPAITVTLSTGKTRELAPCRVEDGRRCYWQADVRGNRIGRSFVVIGGVRYSVNLVGFSGGAR